MATRRLRIPRRRHRVRERGHVMRIEHGDGSVKRVPVRGLPYGTVRACERVINEIGRERRAVRHA